MELLEAAIVSLSGYPAAPVQQVAVETIGPEARKRAFAGLDRARRGCVLRHHLGDEEHLVAPAGDRLRDQQFGIAVEFGRVDVGHAEIEAAAERGNGSAGLFARYTRCPGR